MKSHKKVCHPPPWASASSPIAHPFLFLRSLLTLLLPLLVPPPPPFTPLPCSPPTAAFPFYPSLWLLLLLPLPNLSFLLLLPLLLPTSSKKRLGLGSPIMPSVTSQDLAWHFIFIFWSDNVYAGENIISLLGMCVGVNLPLSLSLALSVSLRIFIETATISVSGYIIYIFFF